MHSFNTIIEVFEYWATEQPNKSALLAPARSALSHANLFKQLTRLSETFQRLGLGRSARIAVLAPNGPELALAFLGCATSATCAPLNPAYQHDELAFYLEDLEASALLIASSLQSPAREVAHTRGIPVLELFPEIEEAAGQFSIEGTTGRSPVSTSTIDTEQVALILHTSGTTAKPKQVPLSHANLCASLHHLQQSLSLVPEDRGLNLMPLFHIHGLVGSLLAAVGSGGSLVCPSGFVSEEFFGLLQEFQPSWYSSVPTVHQAILTQARTEATPRASAALRFIRSSSASLPPTVMVEVEEVFRVPVIEAYGMTEAAHQMASNPLPPAARKPGSVGLPAGPEIAILSEAGKLLSRGDIGEVAIRGPNVMTGYVQNPEANAQAFTNDWFRTGDQGYLDPDGYLFLTGRFKELINRGGEKIAPLEIDQALLAHPAIAQAVTFAQPHPTLGEDVAAAVVLEPETTLTTQELQTFLSTSLAAFKIPRQIMFVTKIPKGPTGKLQRIGLAKTLGVATISTDTDRAVDLPRTALETFLLEIWQEVLGISTIGIHDDFFVLGGDSLSATRLLMLLREQLHVMISFETFFGNLTITDLATLVETIPRLEAHKARPLRALSIDKPMPLSFAQQRMWFLHQLEPGNVAYHCPVHLQLQGPIDLPALEQSLITLVDRHAVLRTKFPQMNAIPMQVVSAHSTVAIARRDWHPEIDGPWDGYLSTVTQQDLQKPFDLAHGPVLRALLVRQNPENSVLLLTFHHIVIDDRSQDILLHDLPKLYDSKVTGQPPYLSPLILQYRDVAVWERERLQSECFVEQIAYWRQQLADLPPLELPLDHPRPPKPTSRGTTVHQTLSPALTAQLHALSQEYHVTLFMTLMAALHVLLFRYTHQVDIAVGTPIANRPHPEMDSIFGFFANTLVLRGDLRGNPSFAEFLQLMRQVATEAYDFQAVPFEQLIEDLQPSRDLSRTPLFQVLLDYQQPSIPTRSIAGLTWTQLEYESQTAKFDLALSIKPTDDGLTLRMEYNTDLFEVSRIERMLGHFEMLLTAIVHSPTTRVAMLPLLTQAERHQLLVDWNDTTRKSPRDTCIHQLFEQQVQLTPNAIALVYEDQQLSYAQLNARANQLAHHLARLEVGPEVRVGVCLERTINMVVALLGILKAGGTYIPLDPAYPEKRIRSMLEDSKAAVLITFASGSKIFNCDSISVVALDNDGVFTEIESHASDKLSHRHVDPNNLAYILYTSGSTGRPKGVGVTHRNVVRLLEQTQSWFQFNEDDIWTCFHSYAFDFSVWELFGALLHGGQVILIPHWMSRASDAFYELLANQRVTVLNQTPSAFQQLIHHEATTSKCHRLALRLVIFGGESLVGQSLAPWVANHGDQRPHLINMFGITETTVHVTYRKLTELDVLPHARSVIGVPIPDNQVYVLNETQQPVPIGVSGELYVGGAGVTRGYVNHPELTSARFVPHPYSTQPGARLYRSGDLARRLPNGELEFLGRMDHQVKVRGFRIELGEIETVLCQYPGVQEVVVLCREDLSDQKQLVAYVVLTPDASLEPSSLRMVLKTHLPDYMVPTSVVILTALPLTPHGKIDRQALLAPDMTHRAGSDAHVAPQTQLEELMAKVWQDILKLERVGRHDNFFELGGHSLLATQLLSRLRDQLEIDLPLRLFFEHPTLIDIAHAIEGRLLQEREDLPETAT